MTLRTTLFALVALAVALSPIMGLGGGDFVAGIVMFAVLGAVVALLMWLGVL